MMETNTNDEITAASIDSLPLQSVGKLLKEARISQGLSVADVAGRIKFAPRQVEALEADDFEHLPELAFVRGFVRSYARLLHIDELVLLDALPLTARAAISVKQSADLPFPTPQSDRRINILWLSAALGLAVLLAIGVLFFHEKPATKKIADTAKIEDVVPATQASPINDVGPVSAVVAASVDEFQHISKIIPASSVPKAGSKEKIVQKGTDKSPIHFVFLTESWVDVKDKFGKTLIKQVNESGTEQWLDGLPPFSVVIGNASGVRLYYEGEEVELKEFTEVEVARLILE
jgi:cytoskeleton protein RodZ